MAEELRLVPCSLDSPANLDDPDFVISGTAIRQSVDKQQRLIQQF